MGEKVNKLDSKFTNNMFEYALVCFKYILFIFKFYF